MRASAKALDLIRRFEGVGGQPVLEAYVCPGGEMTIGYGHTGEVKADDKITVEDAERFLAEDVQWIERQVSRMLLVTVSQSQFDALVSLGFNIGPFALAKSTLLRMLNKRDYLGAANQFLRWVHAGGKKLPGLVKRREAEKALFEGKA